MSYTPPLNGGRINMTISGNTAGVGALASTGTVTLAGGNNITLSQNGNAITISGPNAGGAGFTAGMSTLGNTSGTTGLATNQLVMAGGNNVTLSQSTGAGGNTLTISAMAPQVAASGNITYGTLHTISSNLASFYFSHLAVSQSSNTITVAAPSPYALSAGASNLGNTLGHTGVVNKNLVLVGGNNVTLSGSTSIDAGFGISKTLTISAANQTVQTENLHNVTLSGNTAGVMAQVSSGTLTLAGGNNITLSQNGNAVTISAPNLGAGNGFTAGMSDIGNTSGTTGLATNQLVLAGGNNVTLSQSTGAGGNTVTISAGNGGGDNTTYATMWFPYNEGVNVAGQAGQASLGFMPVPTPANREELRPDRVVFPLYFTNASNSTGSLTASFWMGLYTRTSNSISLAHSSSATATLGFAGNNSSASQRGIRLFTFGWTTTIEDARYVVGIVSRTTTAGANATLSQLLVSQLNSNVSGMWDAANNASIQWPLGVGFYSATTSGIPSVVAYSEIRGTNSLAARPPSWHMLNQSA